MATAPEDLTLEHQTPLCRIEVSHEQRLSAASMCAVAVAMLEAADEMKLTARDARVRMRRQLLEESANVR
jgi:hypothetical protein